MNLLRKLALIAASAVLALAGVTTPASASVAPPGSYCEGLYTTTAVYGVHWTLLVGGSTKQGDYQVSNFGCYDNSTASWANLDHNPTSALIRLSGQPYITEGSASYLRQSTYYIGNRLTTKTVFFKYDYSPWYSIGSYACRIRFYTQATLYENDEWAFLHYDMQVQYSGTVPTNPDCYSWSGVAGTLPPSPYLYWVSAN